jgi:3-hydroxyacyl-CoA dehydrogenase
MAEINQRLFQFSKLSLDLNKEIPMNSPVSYEIVDSIGVITVDNPPVNALSHAVREGILDAIHVTKSDESRAVVILCAGRTFIAGADITEFGKPPLEPYLPDLLNEIEASEKVVIAALHGTVLGGGFETALACHYRIALDSAKLGLFPGAGGTQRVPRLTGIEAAVELMASGNPIGAAQAADLGLVDKVVSDDLRQAALEYAAGLVASGAPIRRTRDLDVEAVDDGVFVGMQAELAKRARGQIAPLKMLEAVKGAVTMPFDEGLLQERALFWELMQGSQSRALRAVLGTNAGLPVESAQAYLLCRTRSGQDQGVASGCHEARHTERWHHRRRHDGGR